MLEKLSVDRNPLARFFAMRISRLMPSATAVVIPLADAITPSQWGVNEIGGHHKANLY